MEQVLRNFRPSLSASLELLKPITWFAPMWAFGCGVVSSGVSITARWDTFLVGVLLCGPMVCGTSQAVNDWFDRHVDAINEPGRPIPSGRLPGRTGLYIAIAWTVLSVLVAATLGDWALRATAIGLILAWAYSAPPLRLKQNGWWGNAACAACYEGLPWITGVAIMRAGAPDAGVLIMAGLYSLGAHGIMTLNDFKSVEGDRAMGIGSLPARLGVARAALVACVVMAVPQAVVMDLLFRWGFPAHGTAVAAVLAAQILLMLRLLGDPRRLAPWYNATGTSLYVIGMLVTAFALRPGASPVNPAPLGWLGILRLGLVQTALGAIVLIVTSSMNRVMVVELALPAMVPGALVALHYAVQLLRPRLGYGADRGGRRTPWIVGGMAVLAAGGLLAALATAWMSVNLAAGLALAVAAFILVGLGVGAAGTSLLLLLASRVAPASRPAAATIVWLMMLFGFAATAAFIGWQFSPYSPQRLVGVTAMVVLGALAMTGSAVWRIEGPPAEAVPAHAPTASFGAALAQVWAEPRARRFTLFVFAAMFAYSAQELILEPFAGMVFARSPAEFARLAGLLHGGVFTGMLLAAIVGSLRPRPDAMRQWAVGGCLAAAVAMLALAASGLAGTAWPLNLNVVLLGIANGSFVTAAISTMMALASEGRPGHAGVRMGLWGAAQAIAFALGGLAGSTASDLARALFGTPVPAYAAVFLGEAALFLVAAWQAEKVFSRDPCRTPGLPFETAILVRR